MQKEDMLQDLDVSPFCEIVYHTPEYEEEWKDLVELARPLHNHVEYEMVKQGERRCATTHLSPQSYDKKIESIMEDGLVWLPIQRTRSYQGFSHKHFPVDYLDMNSSVYGVLARNLEDAFAFKMASRGCDVDHNKIGDLLGFPACCSQAFVDWWPDYYDPVYQCALGGREVENNHIKADSIHIATQQMARYVGFRLTSHFPCSLDCEETIAVGERWYAVAKEYDPKALAALEKILALPGKWSVLHGIATISNEFFTVLSNSLPTKEEWSVEWGTVESY